MAHESPSTCDRGAGLLFGTVLVALIAECIALPMGILTALSITEYAALGTASGWWAWIDLLAAIPSLLFGLWGFLTLQYQIEPLSQLADHHFGWIPIFKTSSGSSLSELHVHRRHRRLSDVRPDRGLHLPGRLRADPTG